MLSILIYTFLYYTIFVVYSAIFYYIKCILVFYKSYKWANIFLWTYMGGKEMKNFIIYAVCYLIAVGAVGETIHYLEPSLLPRELVWGVWGLGVVSLILQILILTMHKPTK